MVSQPDHSSLSGGSGVSANSNTLFSLRSAAKSVIGTASTTGHHRSSRSSARRDHRHYTGARSHAGGGGGGSGASAYVPQNEFPWFSHSGDVEIVVRVPSGHEKRYLLHRHTLTQCSGFFEASTSEPWSRAKDLAALTAQPPPPLGLLGTSSDLARIGDVDSSAAAASGTIARIGTPRKRWRYELDCGSGGDDIPMLVQKEETSTAGLTSASSIFGGATSSSLSSNGRKHASSHAGSRDFFRSVANLPLSANADLPPPTPDEQDILRDYDNLFRIMYNYSPILNGINIADAYVECKSLLTLADQYDALAVVGPRVDHHLLQFQSRLWKQVAKYPISYLRLGYLARSRIIFQEAMIHVVGQWPAGERSLRATLPAAVIDTIEDKVDELEETVSRVEARLFRLNLTTRTGERVSPSTNYLDWLAVSFFRQWVAESTSPPPPPPPPPRNSTAGRHRASIAQPPTQYPSQALVPINSNGQQLQQQQPQSAIPLVPPLASLGRTYRTLGHPTGAGFLGHDECKRFLKTTPELYGRENLRRFEKRIDEMKALAREVVRPLMGSMLELDLAGGSRAAEAIGYLTCTRIEDRDLPWAVGD